MSMLFLKDVENSSSLDYSVLPSGVEPDAGNSSTVHSAPSCSHCKVHNTSVFVRFSLYSLYD